MKKALIIFIRNPVKGRVKTRLAKSIGEEAALAIYRKLVSHTLSIAKDIACDRFLYYDDFLPSTDEWNFIEHKKKLQCGGDLGEKMQAAFGELFGLGYIEIIIIGSDCYELTTAIIEQGFTLLHHYDFVIGPATDGGYYLLGMTAHTPGIFANKNWSTGSVTADTIAGIDESGSGYALLPELSDVDEPEDVPEELMLQIVNYPTPN